jgi:hypothetical protein
MNLQEQLNRIQEMMGTNKTIKVYHISKTPITKIDNRYLSKQTPRDKPEGLWFSYEPNTWKDFYIYDDGDYFTYEITIDTSNLIKLDSIEKINHFNEKYESHKSIFKQDDDMIQEMYGMIWTAPNWLKVKKDYDGVEFPNFEELKNEIDFDDIKNQWLSFIDVNSGCVWNQNSIIDFEEI